MILFKKLGLTAAVLTAAGTLPPLSGSVRAEFLFNSFLVPDASLNADRTSWDVFYTPSGGPNYPDLRAPYGTSQTASQAGFTVPANSNPTDPRAFFDPRNATITQTATDANAFLIGPGSTGNIYSFSGATAYRVDNSTANYATPYNLGTAAFQFQTDGTLIDFDSIRLQYVNGSGNTVSLAPKELLREYRSSGSAFGGLTNRTAVQWDLNGLGIQTYQIVFQAAGSSNSFQIATLATAATVGDIVPASRAWNTTGAGNWNTGSNWQQGSPSVENGNVRFVNPGASTVNLDGNHTVGELRFDTAANTTLNSSGGFTLTANTGITTTAAATGTYAVNANYALNAFNVFDVAAGNVQINGVVSGAYGFDKQGAGALALTNNNTFTGGVSVSAGTLRMAGVNAYAGSTTALFGTLVVAGDAPNNAPGALGNGTTALTVGADSATFANVGDTSAALLVDGSRTVGRNVTLANGTFQKTLGAQNTTPGGPGAVFSGAVALGTSTNVRFTTAAASDRVTFSGGITGGAATTGSTVTVAGPGTVVYAGGGSFAYANATNVATGILQVASGAAFTGNGAMTVAGGAQLVVNGTLGGAGPLTLQTGSVLGGSGAVNRAFTLAAGAAIAPGNGVGTLNTVSQTWAGSGVYRWEISGVNPANSGVNPGQDLVNINGSLNLTATASAPFRLQLSTLTPAGTPGSLAGFDPNATYSWQLVDTSNGVTGFDPAAIQVDSTGFVNAPNGVFNVTLNGNDLYLNYVAVPEPSTYLMIGAGLTAGLFAARRTRRRGA